MYRRILAMLGILVVIVSMTTTSVFAMPDPPVQPAAPVKPFNPNYPPNNPQPPAPSQTGKYSGGISAQAIAKGLPGTAFSFVSTFGKANEGYIDDSSHLNGPDGVTVDKDGNVYVVEEGARLLKFKNDHSLDWQVGIAGFHDESTTGVSWPREVTLGPDGAVWVADSDSVSEFAASDGKFLLRYPPEPWNNSDENTRFYELRGVAFDSSGRLYLSDRGRQRIQVFQLDSGNWGYVATIGITNTSINYNDPNPDSGFNQPAQIVIDSEDNVYIADTNNFRIQKCAPDTSTSWNCSTFHGGNDGGSNDDQLSWAYGLGIDTSNNNIFIADNGNGRIKKCASDGTCEDNFITNLNWPTDVAVSQFDGNIYVANSNEFTIQEFDSAGVHVGDNNAPFAGTIDVPYLTYPDQNHPLPLLNGPRAIDVDSKGNIILAEEWGNRLIKLSPTGAVIWAMGTPGVPCWGCDLTTDNKIDTPTALTIDKTGKIYLVGNSYVRFYNSNGTYWKTFDAGWGTKDFQFENPDGIAVDSSGNIYIADRNAQTVKKYNKLGTLLLSTLGTIHVSGPDNSHFNNPAGLTTDSAGNLYVADHDNCRVQKFNKNGLFLMTFGTTLCGWQIDRLGGPSDVAVDAAGKVYVTEDWNNRVQVFDKTGAYLTSIAGNWGNNTGDLRSAVAIALDAKGNVYVADENNARIQKFAPGVPYWAQQNLDGFGYQNTAIWSVASFKGVLFAGTNNNNQGAQIWRKGSTGWQNVVPDGFEDGSNQIIDHMLEFKGYLYASTINCTNDDCSTSNGGQLWRSPDGYTWQPVVTDGFGDRNRNAEIFHFFILGSQLCTSTWPNSGDAEIWCSSYGEPGTWSQITDAVFAGNQAFPSAQLFNNVLYIGSINSSGGKLYRKGVLAGGTPAAWTEISLPTSFATDGYTAVESMAVYNNNLYVAFSYSQAKPTAKGAAIWRCHVCDGTTLNDWIQEVDNGFDNAISSRAVSLVTLKTGIYAILANRDDGIQVYSANTKMSSENPTSHKWTHLGSDGLGSSSNQGLNHNNATAVVNGTLYLGTLNYTNGGGVWKFCPTAAVCK